MGPWWRLWWDSGGGRGGGRGGAKGRSCAPKAAPLRAGITDHAWCSLSDLSEAVARAHALGTSRASLLSGGVNAKGTKSCPYEALPYGTRPVSPGEPPGGGCPESRGHGMRAAGAGPPLGRHAQGPARGRQRPLGSRSSTTREADGQERWAPRSGLQTRGDPRCLPLPEVYAVRGLGGVRPAPAFSRERCPLLPLSTGRLSAPSVACAWAGWAAPEVWVSPAELASRRPVSRLPLSFLGNVPRNRLNGEQISPNPKQSDDGIQAAAAPGISKPIGF